MPDRRHTRRGPGWAGGLLLALLGACGGGAGGVGDGGEPPYEPPAGDDVRLNTDAAGAELSTFPEIRAEGTRVYVVWYDRRSGTAMDVHFNRSLDGGATWLGSDRRLDTDAAGAANSNIPRIAAAGDRVYVAWSDQRDGPAQIRFNRSLDAGATWLGADVRLDDAGPGAGPATDVSVCGDGDAVYMVWQDGRDGAADVYFNRSLDAGATWLPSDVRLDADAAGAAPSLAPRVACCGADVHVSWQDGRDGAPDIWYRHSPDGGATWAGELRIDGGLAGDHGSYEPGIACQGTRVCVVWRDERDGEPDIYANASADAGASWLGAAVRVDTDAPGADRSARPWLAMQGADAFVVWEDHRNGAIDVYFNRSADGGATWGMADVRLDRPGTGGFRSLAPRIAATATHLHVAWADERKGAFDVLLRTSADRGASWREVEVRLDTDEEGAADSLFPAVTAVGNRAHVVWVDDRHGAPAASDILYNRADAP